MIYIKCKGIRVDSYLLLLRLTIEHQSACNNLVVITGLGSYNLDKYRLEFKGDMQ